MAIIYLVRGTGIPEIFTTKWTVIYSHFWMPSFRPSKSPLMVSWISGASLKRWSIEARPWAKTPMLAAQIENLANWSSTNESSCGWIDADCWRHSWKECRHSSAAPATVRWRSRITQIWQLLVRLLNPHGLFTSATSEQTLRLSNISQEHHTRHP